MAGTSARPTSRDVTLELASAPRTVPRLFLEKHNVNSTGSYV